MKLAIYTQNGKKSTKTVEVADTVFDAKVNDKLLAQYVYIFLSNQRESVADTKDRGQVSGGGKKPWAQKGTGRARAGSSRSPLWKGGGVTFGPKAERNWKLKLPKRMKIAAMRSAFSKLNLDGKLVVVDEIKFADKQPAKQAAEVMKVLGESKKMTVITGTVDKNIMNAFANLPKARVIQVGELSAYDLLNGGKVVMMQDALAFTSAWE